MNKNGMAIAILKKTLDMNELNVKLANHVKDCNSCLTMLKQASENCLKHYEEINK